MKQAKNMEEKIKWILKFAIKAFVVTVDAFSYQK